MRQVVDKDNYNTVKTLIEAGIRHNKIAEITQFSLPTIYRIKASTTYEEYDAERKRKYLEAQMLREKASDQSKDSQVVVTKEADKPAVSPSVTTIVDALTRIAIAIEKSNELASDTYEKIGDIQVSMQELVSAWGSANH